MKTIPRFAICILCLTLVVPLASAEQTELGDVALRQALLDLGTDLRLMCVAAHPDDEDGATLALYRKKYGYKTITVVATRGEGGQNEIGPELYTELGVIRTHEMMRATEITGAELHFLDLPEFGFSKSPEETFQVWGHEETVRRLVRVIRQTQPDVIVTNHGRLKDHGHHQAIGIALQDAFEAAGDPAKFPELAKEGLEPWRPQRLYLRAWEPAPDSVTIDFNELDPIQGKTYAEIAAQALGEHHSQGMGFFIDRYLSGKIQAHYILAKEHPAADNSGPMLDASKSLLFQGLCDRLDGAARIPAHPLESPSELVQLANAAAAGKDTSGLAHRKWERADRAAALASEIRFSATLSDARLVPGQTATVNVQLADFGSRDVSKALFSLAPAGWFNMATPEAVVASVDDQGRAVASIPITAPQDAPITVPGADHLFDPHFLEPQFDVVAEATTADGQATLELRVPVTADVARPVDVAFAGAPYLVRRGVDGTCTFKVLLTNNTPGPRSGTVVFSMAPGFLIDQQRAEFTFAAEGDQKIVPVTANVGENLEPRDYLMNAMVEGESEPHFGLARIVDLQIPEGLNVGVIQSYDDTFMNTLARLKVPHAALTIEDFTPARLDTFTSVIVDIRAYLVRKDLVANNQALLDYATRGGHLIVMYQKTDEWKPEYAPYPIHVSQNRVTREDAPVTLLVPDHPVFIAPNRIEAADWDAWIQERGLYFPGQWDEHYTPLIVCSDPGEDIPPGSFLYAKVGDGDYIYIALGLYRQLRELHPGALRLFVNMLALGV